MSNTSPTSLSIHKLKDNIRIDCKDSVKCEGHRTRLLRRIDFQEKQGLASKLVEAQEYRAKYFQKEEEVDEMTGLSTQEMAKVKHLVYLHVGAGRCSLVLFLCL